MCLLLAFSIFFFFEHAFGDGSAFVVFDFGAGSACSRARALCVSLASTLSLAPWLAGWMDGWMDGPMADTPFRLAWHGLVSRARVA